MKGIIVSLVTLLFCTLFYSFYQIEHVAQDQRPDEVLDQERLLERHNYYRAQLGIEPLEWSDELAEYAQEWADRLAKNCKMEHRTEDDYGENIYWTSTMTDEYRVVDFWAEEEKYFNHRNRLYKPGNGHYTQMIWRETKRMGAAIATCADGGQIWVCNYDPPGNWVGEKAY